MKERTIIVFHCEFSQRRAPNLWSTLRGLDRHINHEKWPKLFFPEMYVLEKGFSSFYARFPKLCQGGYKCQDGDKLEKSRVRSMQRDLKSYKIQDQVVQLKKSASYGHAVIPNRMSNLAASAVSEAETGANLKRVQQPFMIKSSVPAS